MYFQGPFKAQAEYYTSKAKRYDHDNYTSDGYYISGVWNVTGETGATRAAPGHRPAEQPGRRSVAAGRALRPHGPQ